MPPDRRVSFVDWTMGRSPHKQLVLQGHGAYGELTKSYVEGIVGIVAAIVNSVEMRDDPSRKVWFVADEFAQMGKIPARALFEVGRSRGVRCVVACQDFAQLEEIYGAPMVKAIVAMSGTIVVGQMMQGDTAEALCKTFVTREVERANVSSSYQGSGGSSNRSSTLSYNRDEVALYKPSELASRLGLTEDGLGVRLALFTGGDAFELVWPHFQMREEREGHVPAEWTLGCDEGPLRSNASAESPSAGVAPSDAAGTGREASAKDVGAGLAQARLVGEELAVCAEPTLTRSREREADDESTLLLEAVGPDTDHALVHFAQVVEAAIDRRPGPREIVSMRQRPPKEVQ
jgi:hypothetical protein